MTYEERLAALERRIERLTGVVAGRARADVDNEDRCAALERDMRRMIAGIDLHRDLLHTHREIQLTLSNRISLLSESHTQLADVVMTELRKDARDDQDTQTD